MAETLTLDQLAAYGSATSSSAKPRTLTLSDLADYGAPVDVGEHNVGPSQPPSAWKQFVSGATEEQPDDSSHGFLRSFYDSMARPVVGMVHDSYVRGDLGEHVVSEMLDSFKDQLGTFAAHPDIRNLPIVGTGATATAARAQKQFDEGNYSGAAGTLFGFLGQFAAPELIKRPPGVADLPKPVTEAVKAAASKVRSALPDSVPTFPSWATDAAGVVAPPLAFKMRIANRVANVANKFLGPSEADAAAAGSAPLTGADLARQRAILEGRALDRAAVIERMRQRLANPEAPAKPPESWEPGTPGTPAPPARWEPYQTPPSPGAAQPSTPAEAALDRAPEARLTLSPELAARADELREETHASYHAPESKPQALTPANKIQDAADAWTAYQRMQAQDAEWGNRAAKADRFAVYLVKNRLDATPANLKTAAKVLGEREVPSADTAEMIADRVAHAHTTAATETRGVNLESGRPAETETPQPAPAPGGTLDTGGAGGRPQIAAPDRAGAGTSGERTAVDIPGEQRAYPATYAVRELADIQPSHLGETFQPNPEYGYKNDRNYDDPRNQGKIVNWSTREGFNPRNLLNTAPTAEIGPPVVDDAGNVLGGNGRSMIMQRVYRSNPEGAAAYRAELDRTAAHYGIDPASYAHMKEPVLVRTLDPEIFKDETTAQRAVTDFNKTGTAALTPAEQAIADSRGVSLRTLDDIAARMDKEGPDATLAQTLEGRAGVEVMQNLTRDGVISPQEQAKLSTGAKLTRAGKERISGLMLGRFFTDAKQLDSLSDSMRNKMERIAAPLARIEGIPEYSLAGHMREALALVEDSDAHGAATLDDYLAQQGLFSSHEYPPEAIALARALKTRNPVALTNAVRAYATRAKYAKEFQGEGMFGNIPAPLKPAAAFAESFGQ